MARAVWKYPAAAAVLIGALLLGGCGLREFGTNIVKEGSTYEQSAAEEEYAYSTLDAETQEVYNQIVYAIEKRKDEVKLATKSIDVVETAYQAVRYDHCEYFWLDTFSYVTHKNGDTIKSIYFSPEFSMTKKEQEKTQTRIDQAVSELLADAPVDGGDFEKVLYVYTSLIESVDYSLDVSDSQNIISTFLDGETVCQGYAYGTQYLLEELGIPCTTVEGTVRGEGHAWNLVYMDGAYYYLDTTWGNSQYTMSAADSSRTVSKYIDYNFLGITTEELERTHTVSDVIELPECTATEDNYFIHEDVYFDQWNTNAIGKKLREAYENGETEIELKFSNVDLFEQMLQYFIAEAHITDWCRDMGETAYIELDDACTVLFLFE